MVVINRNLPMVWQDSSKIVAQCYGDAFRPQVLFVIG